MRLNINLASQPYEDVKKFLLRWGTLIAVLAIFTGGLVYYAISSWRQSRDVNRQIAMLRQEMNSLDREKAAGMALLNRPDNKAVAEQARFLNEVIARKAFSWTRVFEDLERVMPPRLHVVSIAPELNDQNQLQVRMIVAGDSRERAVELVRKMEESDTFRQAQVRVESKAQQASGTDTVQFEISSIYAPPAVGAPYTPESNGTSGKLGDAGVQKVGQR
ncbi:MAG TPA: PilN domain-containing protein [Clostridia bacterium]|nr:PilN domain-containing protein [Clostridia bacterium]